MPLLTAPDELDLATALPAAGVAAALLVRRSGEASSRSIPLTPGKLTIGSSPQCQVYLPDSNVRPLQCLVHYDAAGLASVTRWAAGVRLNGRDFSKATLANGDVLAAGAWLVEYSAAAVPPPAHANWLEEAAYELEQSGAAVVGEPSRPYSAEVDAPALELGAPAIACETAAPEACFADPSADDAPTFDHASAGEPERTPVAFSASSQEFADRLILRLWTANYQARQRAKSLITSVRAARFDADAREADYAAMAIELNLARAAYDTQAEHEEQFQRQLAEQRQSADERIQSLLAELELAQSQLAAAQATADQQAQRCLELTNQLDGDRARYDQDVLARAGRVAEIEARLSEIAQEREQLAAALQAVAAERDELAELYRSEFNRALELQPALADRSPAVDLASAAEAQSAPTEQIAPFVEAGSADKESVAAEPAPVAAWDAPAGAVEPESAPRAGEMEAEQTQAAAFEPSSPAADAQAELESPPWTADGTANSQDDVAAVTTETPVDPDECTSDLLPASESPVRPVAPDPAAESHVVPSSPRTSAFADPRPPAPPAWAAPRAEQPASEYASASFIDQYRHLLDDGDGGPVARPRASSPGSVALDDEFLSPAQARACASPPDESDEALEAYMANLMKRVCGGAPASPTMYTPVATTNPLTASMSSPYVEPCQATAAACATESIAEPIDFEFLRQASRKTPLIDNLTALREIANSSARTAIASHSDRRQYESALSRAVVAITATVSAGYLMASAPAVDTPQFWGGAASGVVGLIAALQVIKLERRRQAELTTVADPATPSEDA